MDLIEHLLTTLIEECSEVQKACTKALRFGLDDTWPGPESGLPEWKLTPRQEIRHELNDVAGAVSLLRRHGILPDLTNEDYFEEIDKIQKVESLIPYAKKAGTLIDVRDDDLFTELCALFDDKAVKLHKTPGQFTHQLALVAADFIRRKFSRRR